MNQARTGDEKDGLGCCVGQGADQAKKIKNLNVGHKNMKEYDTIGLHSQMTFYVANMIFIL